MPLPPSGRDTSRPQPQSQSRSLSRARSERSSSSPLSSATPSPQLGPTSTTLTTTGATRAAALGKNAESTGPPSRSSSVLSGLDAELDDDIAEPNHLGRLGPADDDLSDEEAEDDDEAAERASSQTSSTIPLSRRSSLNSSSSALTQVDDDEQSVLEDMDAVEGTGHVNGASRDEGEDVPMEPMDVDASVKDEEEMEDKQLDLKRDEVDESLSTPPSKRRRINSSASRRSPSLTPPPSDELSAQPLPDVAADGDQEDDEQDGEDAEDDEEAEEDGQVNGAEENGDSDAEENEGDVTLRQEDLKGAAAVANEEDPDADDLSEAPDPEPEAEAEEGGEGEEAAEDGVDVEDAEEAQDTDGPDAAEEEADHEAADSVSNAPVTRAAHSSHAPLPSAKMTEAMFSLERRFAELRDRLYIERMEEAAEEEEMILNGTHPALQLLHKELAHRREKLHEMASRRHVEVISQLRRVRKASQESVWTWWTNERDELLWAEFEQTWSKRRRLAREKNEIENRKPAYEVPKPGEQRPVVDRHAGPVLSSVSREDAMRELQTMDMYRRAPQVYGRQYQGGVYNQQPVTASYQAGPSTQPAYAGYAVQNQAHMYGDELAGRQQHQQQRQHQHQQQPQQTAQQTHHHAQQAQQSAPRSYAQNQAQRPPASVYNQYGNEPTGRTVTSGGSFAQGLGLRNVGAAPVAQQSHHTSQVPSVFSAPHNYAAHQQQLQQLQQHQQQQQQPQHHLQQQQQQQQQQRREPRTVPTTSGLFGREDEAERERRRVERLRQEQQTQAALAGLGGSHSGNAHAGPNGSEAYSNGPRPRDSRESSTAAGLSRPGSRAGSAQTPQGASTTAAGSPAQVRSPVGGVTPAPNGATKGTSGPTSFPGQQQQQQQQQQQHQSLPAAGQVPPGSVNSASGAANASAAGHGSGPAASGPTASAAAPERPRYGLPDFLTSGQPGSFSSFGSSGAVASGMDGGSAGRMGILSPPKAAPARAPFSGSPSQQASTTGPR